MGCFTDRTARHQARLRTVTLHRRLSLPGLVLAAALTGSAADAQVIACQSEKGDGYPWAWREIDGKRCWYKGKPGMDKKLLGWAESTGAPAAPKRRSPAVIEDHTERERLLHSYWPPPPPADGFNDRFEASRASRM